MLSNFLIQDKFSEFDELNSSNQNQNQNQKSNKNVVLQVEDKYSSNLIEQIDDKNYNSYEQEVAYKIFEDISSISKKNNMIELILEIPIDNNILFINKIKLSNKINEYIKDIYVCINGDIIISKDDFINKQNDSSKLIKNTFSSKKIINCQNVKNVNLHIFLSTNIINKIINKTIFINYSYTVLKNKVKFINLF